MSDKVTIIQGENAVFTIKLRDSEGDPIDLTPYDKYKVCLPTDTSGGSLDVSEVANGNGSIVTVDGDNLLGKLQIQIKAADTLSLLEEERMSIDLELDNAGTPAPKRAKFQNVLTVLSSLC